MKCEELVSYLSDYIDRELDEELTAEAREHLATCENCRVMLDTAQKTIFLYQQTGRRAIPAARRQRLFTAIEAAFLKQASRRNCPEKEA